MILVYHLTGLHKIMAARAPMVDPLDHLAQGPA